MLAFVVRMPQFLNSGSQLSSRLGHADWFLHLFNRAAKRMTAISQLPGLDPRVVKRCTAVLVKIWCVCAPRGHCHEGLGVMHGSRQHPCSRLSSAVD